MASEKERTEKATVALMWLTRYVSGMIARFTPAELELALTVLLARLVRQAYPARTRDELAEHVRWGIVQSLEGTDADKPEEGNPSIDWSKS